MNYPLLAAVFGLASAAAGQPAFLNFPLTERSLPTTPSVTNFTGSVAGHFTGAGYPDVVTLQNGTPILFSSPSVHNAFATIAGAPSGCTAIATRHRQRGSSTRWLDQLVVSNGAGLSHWWFNGTQMAWESVPSSVSWKNMKQLVAAEVSGDALEDLIGIEGGGFTVRVKISNGVGYGSDYSRTFANAVLAIAAIDWDASPATPRALAVATTAGVEICSVGAGLSTIAVVTGTSGTKATLVTARRSIDLAGQGPKHYIRFEFLALTVLNGTAWALRPIMPSVTATPVSIALPGVDVAACMAGDIDGDLHDELSYSQRNNHRCLVLMNRSPNNYLFAYGPTDAVELPLIGPADLASASQPAAPDNNAAHVFADLDGNGRADLVHPVESTTRVAVTINPVGDRSVRVASARLAPEASTRTFTLILDPYSETQGLLTPAGATHWEVVIWPVVFENNGFRPANDIAQITTTPMLIQPSAASVALNIPASTLTGPNALLVQARAVTISNGNIEQTHGVASYMFGDAPGFDPAPIPQTPMWNAIMAQKPGNLNAIPFAEGDGSNVGAEVPVVPPPPINPPPVGPG